MFKDFFNKSFLVQIISFWMISFIVFAPTANILFSIPKEARAAEPTSIADSITYSAAIPVCESIAIVRKAITKIWAATTDVPSADASAGGTTAGATMQTCYKEWGDKIKTKIIESIKYAATTVMQQLLLDLTNNIVKCINTYDPQTGDCAGGDSLLVLDFNSLLENAADIAGARFLNELTGVNLCSTVPAVKLQIALLPTPDFKQRSACTLDKIVSNITSFYNDFTNGGWAAWDESAKPNNNAFGEWITATNETVARQFAASQKANKETTNGFKPTKKCISSTDETAHPASTLKADDVYCSASMVITPSGTVESSVNFSALSPIRSLENNLAALYGDSPFGIALTAVSNALLNKVTTVGLSALMSEITSTAAAANPYQSVIDSTAAATVDYSAAQSHQSYATSIIAMLGTLDSYITSPAKTIYSDIISILTNIRSEQNKVMTDYWAQGIIDSDTISSTISGPTTIINSDGSQTTTTIYNISNPKIGTATVQKQTVVFLDSTTTTTYSLISGNDEIEDVTGTLTSYTNKYNSLLLTQSQIPAAKTQTQNTYNAATTYLNSWTGTNGSPAALTAMNTSIASTVSYFQNSSNWTPALTSTTLGDVSSNITSIYDTTVTTTSTELTEQTKSTYSTYLSDVQTIYSNLGLLTTKL